MAIFITKKLNITTGTSTLPANLSMKFDARAQNNNTSTRVTYSLNKTHKVSFEINGAQMDSFRKNIVLGGASKTISTNVRMVKDAGFSGPINVTITASVLDPTLGISKKTVDTITVK